MTAPIVEWGLYRRGKESHAHYIDTFPKADIWSIVSFSRIRMSRAHSLACYFDRSQTRRLIRSPEGENTSAFPFLSLVSLVSPPITHD